MNSLPLSCVVFSYVTLQGKLLPTSPVGDGEELERALDDVYGTGVTVRSCCEK